MTDYTQLRKLAEAATPGPFAVWLEPTLSVHVAAKALSDLALGTAEFSGVIPMVVDSRNLCVATTGCGKDGTVNAAFIAAANPQAVIELLDEIERLRKDAERWQWWRKHEGAANRIWRSYLENCPDVECLDFDVDAAMVK